ncbi:MAG TPA: hypothetical protein VEI97_05775 [bacterium]|nr:hypothetical protein [bacterium]
MLTLAGCGGGRPREPKPEDKPINPTHPPLIIPPAAAAEEPQEPAPPVILIEENPRARVFVCWLWDRVDGIYAYPDEAIKEYTLTLPEAVALGIPQDVWFFALANPEAAVVFMTTRRLPM